jgi:hypothetical protein
LVLKNSLYFPCLTGNSGEPSNLSLGEGGINESIRRYGHYDREPWAVGWLTTGITADTALRLGKALGTSAQLWMNLQNRYDVEVAKRAIGKKLDKIEPVIAHEAA